MRAWWTMEASLDELLEDEIMERVTGSAGLTVAEFRSQLAALARRLERRRPEARLCCGAGA